MPKNAAALVLLLLLSACADMPTAKTALEKKDYAVARKNLDELTRRGFPDAQTKLGGMYMTGTGAPRDLPQALSLCKQAWVAQHYPPALLCLGDAFRNGTGVRKNAALAKEAFTRALALGDTHAYARLGLLEQEAGHYAAAEKLFTQALAAGDTAAYLPLGDTARARGNFADAEAFYKQALALGVTRAELKIGDLYNRDGGDGAKALYWFYKARKDGVPEAGRHVTHAERKLQPEEIARALRLAAEDAK